MDLNFRLTESQARNFGFGHEVDAVDVWNYWSDTLQDLHEEPIYDSDGLVQPCYLSEKTYTAGKLKALRELGS